MKRLSEAGARRRIPPVDRLLRTPELEAAAELYGREAVRERVRAALADLRRKLASGPEGELERRLAELPARLAGELESIFGAPLRRVINATGIFVHTNLGRSPLPPAVAAALPALLDGYCDLELELTSGERGDRNRRLARLLASAAGSDAALVVNNNAAALVLALAALGAGGRVVVSRGELVEIGGSFRLPEIVAAAGVELMEVGTTNRTRIDDYRAALDRGAGMLLKVYPSNYRQIGFVESVAPAALVALARERGAALVVDEGSGLVRPRGEAQLAGHPSLAELVAAGCDLACGSGDKLLGGPQAGLLVGAAAAVARCRRHPLYRALRPDRAGVAALEAVLRLQLAGAPMPIDRLWPEPGEHRRRLEAAARPLGADIEAAEAFIGGGSAPERPIAGEALALPPDPDVLAALRRGTPPVVGYIRAGRLILDLRTVDPRDDETLIRAVEAARASAA